MENQNRSIGNYADLLSEKRFKLGYSVVKERIELLINEDEVVEERFKKVQEEDSLLKIKYRTYKKCIRKLIIGLFLLGGGLLLDFSFKYLVLVSGVILSISSFFGILSSLKN